MISTTALNLWKGILNGDYTYSQLQTALGTASRLADFRQICVSESAVSQLIQVPEIWDIIKLSSIARENIFKIESSAKIWASNRYAIDETMKIGSAAAKALNSTASYFALKDNADNWNYLKTLVNNSGKSSKLKAQGFLQANGSQTWTYPVGGITAINIIGIGGGHVNGGGGEVVIETRTSSLPSTDQSVSFPSPSPRTNAVFGSYVTALGAGSGGIGGGSDVNGGYRSIPDYDIENTPWLPYSCNAKGGDGNAAKAGGVNTGVWGIGGTGGVGGSTAYLTVNWIEV